MNNETGNNMQGKVRTWRYTDRKNKIEIHSGYAKAPAAWVTFTQTVDPSREPQRAIAGNISLKGTGHLILQADDMHISIDDKDLSGVRALSLAYGKGKVEILFLADTVRNLGRTK